MTRIGSAPDKRATQTEAVARLFNLCAWDPRTEDVLLNATRQWNLRKIHRQSAKGCRDYALFLDGDHVQRVVREYTAYYNRERSHQAIGQRIPNQYDLLKSMPTSGRIRFKAILGGLHHSNTRANYFK